MTLDIKKIKKKALAEFKSAFFLTIYFAAFFGALTTYKRLILAQHTISFAEYGISLIDALILAKVILIGAAFRVGSRFNDRPLIIPALYKTFCFSIIVLALSLAERIIKGLWTGNAWADILNHTMAEKWAILSRILMMYFAFIPFFAFWEVNRLIGGDVLRKIFFEPRSPGDMMHFTRDESNFKS